MSARFLRQNGVGRITLLNKLDNNLFGLPVDLGHKINAAGFCRNLQPGLVKILLLHFPYRQSQFFYLLQYIRKVDHRIPP